MKENKMNFPIYFISSSSSFFKDQREFLDFGKLNFHSKNSIFYYPFMLVSAGFCFKDKNFIKKCGIDFEKDKDVFLMGDSGGFQIINGTLDYKKIDNLELKILEWLEENSNYAMVLDFPLYARENSFDDNLFSESLKLSSKSYKFFYENRKGKTKFLNILHGLRLKQAEEWYDMMKDFDFEGGIALGGIVNKPFFYPLQNFFFLLKKGALEKYKNKKDISLFHFLGVSHSETIILLAYLQKKLNQLGYNIVISYDSSSIVSAPGLGGRFFSNNYYYNNNFNPNIVNSKLQYKNDYDNIVFIEKINNREIKFKDIYKLYYDNHPMASKSLMYYVFSNLNVISFIQYKKFVDSFVIYGDYDLYKFFLKDRFVMEKMKLIDLLFEADNKDWWKILNDKSKLFLPSNNFVNFNYDLF